MKRLWQSIPMPKWGGKDKSAATGKDLRLELVLKPNRIALVQPGDTLLSLAERYGTTPETLRSLNSDICANTVITTAAGDTLNSRAGSCRVSTSVPSAGMCTRW